MGSISKRSTVPANLSLRGSGPGAIFPGFFHGGREQITLRQLLPRTSGLPFAGGVIAPRHCAAIIDPAIGLETGTIRAARYV